MKIRTKLTVLFTLLTALVLLVFSALVYFSAHKSRESEFYKRLREEAVTKANLFFRAKVDPTVLQTIYKSNRETISEVEVSIYDAGGQLLYHDAVGAEAKGVTPALVRSMLGGRELNFYDGDSQEIGMPFLWEKKSYFVMAAAYDQYGYKKLASLRITFISVFFGSVLFIYLLGRFFSERALLPVTGIVRRVKGISASNLDLRLEEAKGKDEIAQLAHTFNEMLDRLEGSFEAQKQFVSNISHELRTPIAALIAELELASEKERQPEEYKRVIRAGLNDARKLAKLTGSLLDFAKANYDASEIAFRELRPDELLLDASTLLIRQNPDFKIDISYSSETDEDEELSVMGNEYLLKVAFANLMENGCKFSADRSCHVQIGVSGGKVTLSFKDQGIGIARSEIERIFTPFYRGNNQGYAPGNGIGLSLTKRIIDLHDGLIYVTSDARKGTVFTVVLDHI